jgi:hypothetical protein
MPMRSSSRAVSFAETIWQERQISITMSLSVCNNVPSSLARTQASVTGNRIGLPHAVSPLSARSVPADSCATFATSPGAGTAGAGADRDEIGAQPATASATATARRQCRAIDTKRRAETGSERITGSIASLTTESKFASEREYHRAAQVVKPQAGGSSAWRQGGPFRGWCRGCWKPRGPLGLNLACSIGEHRFSSVTMAERPPTNLPHSRGM